MKSQPKTRASAQPRNERRDWSQRQRAIVHWVLLSSTAAELEMIQRMCRNGLLLMNDGENGDTRRADLNDALKHVSMRLESVKV